MYLPEVRWGDDPIEKVWRPLNNKKQMESGVAKEHRLFGLRGRFITNLWKKISYYRPILWGGAGGVTKGRFNSRSKEMECRGGGGRRMIRYITYGK